MFTILWVVFVHVATRYQFSCLSCLSRFFALQNFFEKQADWAAVVTFYPLLSRNIIIIMKMLYSMIMTVKTPLWLERSDLWLYDCVWVIIPSQNPSSSGDQASRVSAFLVTVSAKHCARQRVNCRQKYGYSRLAVKYNLSESSQHTCTNILLSFFLLWLY